MKYKSYVFPKWAEYLGWCIALSSILAIPIYAIVLLCKTNWFIKRGKKKKKHRKFEFILLSFFLLFSDG